MKSISHSQFSAYNECNLKWKLRYIDKLSKFSGSIHTVFGTAMHTTIQAYLTEFYNKSIKSADSMDLVTMLKEEMIKEFIQIREQHKVDVCDQKDGVAYTGRAIQVMGNEVEQEKIGKGRMDF